MKLRQPISYENPPAGACLATIIDVYDRAGQQTSFGVQDRVVFVWAISRLDGQPILGKDPEKKETYGKPLTYQKSYNGALSAANSRKKTDLTTHLEQILGGPVPMIAETEQLEQLVLGRSHSLFLVEGVNTTDPTKPYINISGIAPLSPGMVGPQAPAGFVRAKFRGRQQAGPQGQQVTTYAQPPQAAPAGQPQQQTQVAPAVPNNNVAF